MRVHHPLRGRIPLHRGRALSLHPHSPQPSLHRRPQLPHPIQRRERHHPARRTRLLHPHFPDLVCLLVGLCLRHGVPPRVSELFEKGEHVPPTCPPRGIARLLLPLLQTGCQHPHWHSVDRLPFVSFDLHVPARISPRPATLPPPPALTIRLAPPAVGLIRNTRVHDPPRLC